MKRDKMENDVMKTLFKKAITWVATRETVQWFLSLRVVRIYLQVVSRGPLTIVRMAQDLWRGESEVAFSRLNDWFQTLLSLVLNSFKAKEEAVKVERELSLDDLPPEVRAAMDRAAAL